jgi:hypothetical protein
MAALREERRALLRLEDISFSFKYFISEGMYNSLFIAQD